MASNLGQHCLLGKYNKRKVHKSSPQLLFVRNIHIHDLYNDVAYLIDGGF